MAYFPEGGDISYARQDPDFNGTNTQDPAPTQPTQPAPTQQPKAPTPEAPIQDNPDFRNLPRSLQRQIEAGQLSLADALKQNANSPADKNAQIAKNTGVAGPSQEGGSPAGPAPSKNATSQPNRPAPQATLGGPNTTVAEGVDVADVTGESTFARPGTRAFQPFAGRALASQLRDVGSQANIAYQKQLDQARQTGDLSRTFSTGIGGGGATLGDSLGGNKRDQLTETILRQMGLA